MCQPVINRAWRLRSMTTAASVWERRSGHAGQRIPDPSAIRGRRRMACKIRRHSWPLRKMPPLADGHFHARAVRQSLCLARGFEVRECARESAQTTVDPAAIPSSAKHVAPSALVQARKPRYRDTAGPRYRDTAIPRYRHPVRSIVQQTIPTGMRRAFWDRLAPVPAPFILNGTHQDYTDCSTHRHD